MGLWDVRFGAYVAVAALLIVTPGPDMALVTRNALLAGRRPASFTALGIGAGSVVWALASVLGIAVLLEKSVVAFTICKLVGAAYLTYLGVRSLIHTFRRNKSAASIPDAPAPQAKQLSERAAFRQASSTTSSIRKPGRSLPRSSRNSSTQAIACRDCC